MRDNRFLLVVLAAFMAGAALLVIIQYNSSANIERLISGNEQLLTALKCSNYLREMEQDIIWVESRIRGAIATGDTSHLEGIDDKIARVESLLDTLKRVSGDDSVALFADQLGHLARRKQQTKDQLLRRFQQTGRMDDASLVANPQARAVSNQISDLTDRIHLNRRRLMIQLSRSSEESGRNARLWGNVLITAVVVGAGAGIWLVLVRIQWQQRLIRQLDESQKKAREAARIKEQFMSNMSHEIRTPLNAIVGFTNLLRKRPLDGESAGFVEAIGKAGENLLDIVNDILDLAKMEAGKIRFEARPFNVRDLLHSVQTLFSEKIHEKGLVLREEIAPEVPRTLTGDPTRLTQILVNLVGNAVKFTAKGHIRVRVYTKSRQGNRLELGVEVSDTGIGIAEKNLPGIFERFQQAEDSTTRRYGGTGLGLSIVQELVHLQGGDIGVESQPGRGTTFRFFIPYTLTPEPVASPAGPPTAGPGPDGVPGGRLLVVEDNPVNQGLMRHLLDGWHLAYDLAGDGAEAIGYLQANAYDLVLLDIQMPRMDGYTTSQYVREELKLEVPIVAMTACAMPGEREKCLRYGMNDYIAKPIREQELYRLISRFVPLPAGLPADGPGAAREGSPYQCISLHYLHQISRGDKMYEKTVTGEFMETVPAELRDLAAAFTAGDFRTLRQVAHSLKTSISIMGLTDRLAASLDALEEAGPGDPQVPETIATVTAVCRQALREAGRLYASL